MRACMHESVCACVMHCLKSAICCFVLLGSTQITNMVSEWASTLDEVSGDSNISHFFVKCFVNVFRAIWESRQSADAQIPLSNLQIA